MRFHWWLTTAKAWEFNDGSHWFSLLLTEVKSRFSFRAEGHWVINKKAIALKIKAEAHQCESSCSKNCDPFRSIHKSLFLEARHNFGIFSCHVPGHTAQGIKLTHPFTTEKGTKQPWGKVLALIPALFQSSLDYLRSSAFQLGQKQRLKAGCVTYTTEMKTAGFQPPW